MIHLVDVSKVYQARVGRRTILHRTNLSIPSRRNVALLGRNGAGKSTLVRLISGVEKPTTGHIVRQAHVSWPLGFGGSLHGSLTGRQNISFVARLYERDPKEMFDFVADFSELGSYLDQEVQTYSAGMRGRLAFGISLAVDFDCYLIDEALSTGDRWFREKSRAAFEARRQRCGLLFVSHNAQSVKQFCDCALVLIDGRLVPFDDIDDAIRFYHYGIYRPPRSGADLAPF